MLGCARCVCADAFLYSCVLGQEAEAAVDTFVTSHGAVAPVIIVSYEVPMARRMGTALQRSMTEEGLHFQSGWECTVLSCSPPIPLRPDVPQVR